MGAGAALRRGDIRLEHFKTDLTAGDRRSQAAQWAADETWVRCRKYENDPEYMECVKDILAHPVFNSMDQYIPVSYTHLGHEPFPGAGGVSDRKAEGGQAHSHTGRRLGDSYGLLE